MSLVQISSRTHTPAAQDPKGGHIYRPSQGTFSFGADFPRSASACIAEVFICFQIERGLSGLAGAGCGS